MLRLLYFSSFLSAWGNRMWEFAVYISISYISHDPLSTICGVRSRGRGIDLWRVLCGVRQWPGADLADVSVHRQLAPGLRLPIRHPAGLRHLRYGSPQYIYIVYIFIYIHTLIDMCY
jgi:hypothetical protein